MQNMYMICRSGSGRKTYIRSLMKLMWINSVKVERITYRIILIPCQNQVIQFTFDIRQMPWIFKDYSSHLIISTFLNVTIEMHFICIIIRMTSSNILDVTQTVFHQEKVTIYVVLWFHQYQLTTNFHGFCSVSVHEN